jgi:hypothetical protein
MFFVRGVALYRAFSLSHGSSCDYLPLMVLECTKMRIVAIGSPGPCFPRAASKSG